MAPLLGFTTPGAASTMERIRLGWVWLSRARRSAEPRNLVECPGAAAAVCGFVGLSEHSACNIREGYGQSPGSQIDAEHVTTLRAQFVQHRGPPDITAGSSHRAYQPLLLECVDDFRHRLFRQTRSPWQGRPARWDCGAEGLRKRCVATAGG